MFKLFVPKLTIAYTIYAHTYIILFVCVWHVLIVTMPTCCSKAFNVLLSIDNNITRQPAGRGCMGRLYIHHWCPQTSAWRRYQSKAIVGCDNRESIFKGSRIVLLEKKFTNEQREKALLVSVCHLNLGFDWLYCDYFSRAKACRWLCVESNCNNSTLRSDQPGNCYTYAAARPCSQSQGNAAGGTARCCRRCSHCTLRYGK